MKKMILASIVFLGSSAFADTTLFKCSVASSTNSVTATVTLGDDASVDFVTVTLAQKSGNSTFFSQMDKGAANQQIQGGFLQFLALTEKSAQGNDGVITNTGFFALSKGDDGNFTGFLAANSNIYPLTCTK